MSDSMSRAGRSSPAPGHVPGSRRAGFARDVEQALALRAPHDTSLRLDELGRGVYRVRGRSGAPASVIAKRLTVARANRERRVLAEWLPALGLAGLGPALLDHIEEERHAVLVYEDLGDRTVEALGRAPGDDRPRDRGFLSPLVGSPGREAVEAAARTLAELHRASRGHAVLGSIRRHAPDLGPSGHARRIEAVARSVRRLRRAPAGGADPPDRSAPVARLEAWLEQAHDGGRDRPAADESEPVFLHGDAGVRNVIVAGGPEGMGCRLIDWDHCGVGPAAYDLSTFVLQLAPSDRRSAVEAYQDARPAARRPAREWRTLFRVAEEARLASALAGVAAKAAEGEEWAYEAIDEVMGWFEALSVTPLLDTDGGEP